VTSGEWLLRGGVERQGPTPGQFVLHWEKSGCGFCICKSIGMRRMGTAGPNVGTFLRRGVKRSDIGKIQREWELRCAKDESSMFTKIVYHVGIDCS
jgi:hypothetical protein